MFPLKTLNYPYRLSTVFPPLSLDSNGSANGIMRSSASSPRKPANALDMNIEMLETLRVVDYRYSRFALDPRTGLFHMTRSDNFSLVETERTDIPSVTGEILLGIIYYPYKMAYPNHCGHSASFCLVVTR